MLFGHRSYFKFLKFVMFHSATGHLCRLHIHLVHSKFSPTPIPTSCTHWASTNSLVFRIHVTSSACHHFLQTNTLDKGSLLQASIELCSSPSHTVSLSCLIIKSSLLLWIRTGALSSPCLSLNLHHWPSCLAQRKSSVIIYWVDYSISPFLCGWSKDKITVEPCWKFVRSQPIHMDWSKLFIPHTKCLRNYCFCVGSISS